MKATGAPLRVTASGLLTGLGYNARATLAGLRAGVSGVRAETWPDFESGKMVRCARVSLPQRHAGTDLLVDLIAPAIDECLVTGQLSNTEQVPLLVGVPRADQPGCPADIERTLLPEIYHRLDAAPCRDSKVYAADQAGCAFALIEAQRRIESGAAEQVVVAGVDTLLDRPTITAYAMRRRLLTPTNFNGFLPGEAGAAVLVRAGQGSLGGLQISGLGYAQEPATVESTKPLRGSGLTAAIKKALENAGVTMPEINFHLSDLSGEHYKFKEAMFAVMRLDQAPRQVPLDMWYPIQYLGEIRSAVLPCLLAWTLDAFRCGYAPGPNALIHLGSDDGHRFALVAQAA